MRLQRRRQTRNARLRGNTCGAWVRALQWRALCWRRLLLLRLIEPFVSQIQLAPGEPVATRERTRIVRDQMKTLIKKHGFNKGSITPRAGRAAGQWSREI